MGVNYVGGYVLPRDPLAPDCEVCGALMVPSGDGYRYQCLSCGNRQDPRPPERVESHHAGRP